MDLCCSLNGHHVTAAGDHGTEQVRVCERRQENSSREQEGKKQVLAAAGGWGGEEWDRARVRAS